MPAAICVGVADVRREPDAASELVTQALLGARAEPGSSSDGWHDVQLVDYEGWVRVEHLASSPEASADQVAVVTALATPLFQTEAGDAQRNTLYCSSVLPLTDINASAGRLALALPGGEIGWVNAADVAVRPKGIADDGPGNGGAHHIQQP